MTTMTSEREALLPCPFCGSDQVCKAGVEYSYVTCTDCGAEVSGRDYSDAEAIAAWNRRVHLSQPAQAVDVGTVLQVIAEMRGFRNTRPPNWNHLDAFADKLTAALPNANGKEGSSSLEPDYYVLCIDGQYRLADPQPTVRRHD